MCDLNSMKRIWSYTTCNILPSKINNKLRFLLSSKPTLILELFQYDELRLIALKVSSSESKRIFLPMESVQISPRVFVCERQESRCQRIPGKKLGQSETLTSKTDLLIFLTNKKLLAGTIHLRFLIYLKAPMNKK